MIYHTRTKCFAFTLVETIVVLMIATLILMAVLGVYNRVRGSAVRIMDRLEQNRLQTEVLQKIAEDIDRLAAPGFEASINFNNKLDNGYRSAQLILENSYYGSGGKRNTSRNSADEKNTFEQIIWRASYDPVYDTLKLYRLHGGLNVEDKVLEKDSESSSGTERFILVTAGLTHFEIKARQGETILGDWTSDALPKAVRVGLSFAPLQELEDGSVGVPEEQIFYRTIAIDRTRLIPYQFIKKKFDLPEEDPNDVTTDPNNLPEQTDGGGIEELEELTDETES